MERLYSPSTSSKNREDGQNRQNVAKIEKAKISGLFAVGQFLLALCKPNKCPSLKTCRRTGWCAPRQVWR